MRKKKMTTSSNGFQVEMRLVHVLEGDEAPTTYLGVGGYKVAPEDITNSDKFMVTRQKLHMIADELLNKASTVINDGEFIVKEISNSDVGAGQLREFAGMLERGEYGLKVCAQTLENDDRIITFTLTNLEGN
jgi:hypothetical protein